MSISNHNVAKLGTHSDEITKTVGILPQILCDIISGYSDVIHIWSSLQRKTPFAGDIRQIENIFVKLTGELVTLGKCNQ